MEGTGQVKVERKGGLLARLRPQDGQPEGGIDSLVRSVKSYNPKADLKELQRAFAFAETSHQGQKRASGEDFIEHPLGVAQILADLGMDTTTLVAALLHDVVEDTEGTLEEGRADFGDPVAQIADALTKLDKITSRSSEAKQTE